LDPGWIWNFLGKGLDFLVVLHMARAYERGVREVHCTWARKVQGPGKMKARRLRFSVTKPKLMVAFSICSAG